MLTIEDQKTVRAIVREEIQECVSQHLVAITTGVLGPMASALQEILLNQKLLSDGQALVERTLLDRQTNDEPWRESLGDD